MSVYLDAFLFGGGVSIALGAVYAIYKSGVNHEKAKRNKKASQTKDKQLKNSVNRPDKSGIIDSLRDGTF